MGAQVSASVAETAFAVTKSDATQISFSYLYVGTAGDVYVDTEGGQTDIVYKNVAAGSYIWVRGIRVKAATTAADIVGHR